MAWCPFAIRRDLNRTSPPLDGPTAAVLHSNAGPSGDLLGWWESNPEGLMSHFQVGIDGTLWQYVDTTRQAYANVAANAFAVSFETANHRDAVFDADPWSPPQMATLTRALDWLCTVHPTIPRALCTDARHGIGWHEQHPSWTTPGHHCPGTYRVRQLTESLIPSLTQEDIDMTADELRVIVSQEVAKVLRTEGVSGVAGQVAAALRSEGLSGLADRVAEIARKLEA